MANYYYKDKTFERNCDKVFRCGEHGTRIRDVALATPHVKANGVRTADRARFQRAAGQVPKAFIWGV